MATFKTFKESDMNIHDPPSIKPSNGKRVSYYYDNDTGNYTYGLGHPMKPHRMRMTHSLVTNYGLFADMNVLHPRLATKHEMTRFHSDEYIEFLSKVTPSTVEELTGSGARFLVGEDCPAFDGVYEFCQISAGGSICAAEKLVEGSSEVCVNWAGGLHHAKKREASGFCYVNDIVLAILELLKHHQRVLYIDIDIHHGDGVEEAFYTTDRVMTCSFHKFGEYFPGTGDVRDTGYGKGKGYAVNVPLRDGIDDWNFKELFEPVIQRIMDWYRPGAVVLQCGADSLAGDKLGCFNLSMRGHASCVNFMNKFHVPLLVLGGGGYTIRNVARAWAYETGLLLGKNLDEDLPYNDYFEYFGPEYKLAVPANNMKNHNTPRYLSSIVERIFEQMRHLPFAPSVGLQMFSRSVLSRYGGDDEDGLSDDEDNNDNLDARIIKKMRMARLAAGKEAYDDTPATKSSILQQAPSAQSDAGNGRQSIT